MAKYSDKIKNEAKKLFMQNLSLEIITEHLKATFKRACKGLHRSTVQTWIKRFDWEVERSALIKKAMAKSKGVQVAASAEPQTALVEYHAESYKMDSELRGIVFNKLKVYFTQNECTALTVRLFIDVYRISTANLVKLFELIKDDDDNELLDDLLKIRGLKTL